MGVLHYQLVDLIAWQVVFHPRASFLLLLLVCFQDVDLFLLGDVLLCCALYVCLLECFKYSFNYCRIGNRAVFKLVVGWLIRLTLKKEKAYV
jgi:hypothetical protein